MVHLPLFDGAVEDGDNDFNDHAAEDGDGHRIHHIHVTIKTNNAHRR